MYAILLSAVIVVSVYFGYDAYRSGAVGVLALYGCEKMPGRRFIVRVSVQRSLHAMWRWRHRKASWDERSGTGIVMQGW